MKFKYSIGLDGSGLDELIRGVEEYEKWLKEKAAILVQKLADLGVEVASVGFANAAYDGTNDVSVNFEERGELTRAVVATGKATLFIEFGAGLIGYGHPEPQEYGPGTYPGKGHWNDPNGWYYEHGKKSYGNPPAAAMYNARKQLEQDFDSIAREVFSA